MKTARISGFFFPPALSLALALALLPGCGYRIFLKDSVKEDAVAAIAEETSRVRGLPLKEPVETEVIGKERGREIVREMLEREYPPEKIAAWERAYAAMGLIPEGTDLLDTALDLYEEQAAGFYNPETKRLYLVGGAIPRGFFLNALEFLTRRDLTGELLLSHELTHALQDQSFDLEELVYADRENDDEDLAVHALVEGDASVACLEVLARSMGRRLGDLKGASEKLRRAASRSGKVLRKAPLAFRELLIFPYAYGIDFTAALLRNGGWRRVDRAYASPPEATEQVMHPSKYLRGEKDFQDAKLPDMEGSLPEGWKRVEGNTMGEFMTGLLLRCWIPEKEGFRAARGWGGDRFHYFEGPGGSLLVWRTLWDERADAAEFVDAMKALLKKRFPTEEAPYDFAGVYRCGAGRWGRAALIRKPLEVVFLQGESEALGKAAETLGLMLKRE